MQNHRDDIGTSIKEENPTSMSSSASSSAATARASSSSSKSHPRKPFPAIPCNSPQEVLLLKTMYSYNPFIPGFHGRERTWDRIIVTLHAHDDAAVARKEHPMFEGVLAETCQRKWAELAKEHEDRIKRVCSKTGAVPNETERERLIDKIYTTYVAYQKRKARGREANARKRKKLLEDKELEKKAWRQTWGRATFHPINTSASSSSSTSSLLPTSSLSQKSPLSPTSPLSLTSPLSMTSPLSTTVPTTQPLSYPALAPTLSSPDSPPSPSLPALQTNSRKRRPLLNDLEQTRDDSFPREEQRHQRHQQIVDENEQRHQEIVQVLKDIGAQQATALNRIAGALEALEKMMSKDKDK